MDGVNAVKNLEAQLAGVRKRLKVAPDDPAALELLVDLLLRRASTRARVSDYDEALTLAPRIGPLARARVYARLHRFDDALAELANRDDDAAAKIRADIDFARGKIDDAHALYNKLAEKRALSWGELGTLGALQAARGDFAAATASFRAARDKVRDANPFSAAWIEAEEARAFERQGDDAKARELLEIAHARLPPHAGIAMHLVAYWTRAGELERAAELLERLRRDGGDDPELLVLLAEVRARDGKDAKPLVAEAAAGFESLLAKHPLAFADHAARFWLGPGLDAKKAHHWAEKNLENRRDEQALELAISAALAANATARACALADEVRSTDKRIIVTVWRAYTACGREADAARLGL